MPGHVRRPASSLSLSQHLLRNQSVADRIIAATGLAPPALVFDLGAGDGALAAAMVARSCRVVAVEIDRAMWLRLKQRFRDQPQVEPVLSDLLQIEFPARARYFVVSNVPFAATARLMRRLQELSNPPSSAWLVLQEEAARRWAGVGHETVMSVLLKVKFDVNVVLAMRRTDFVPRPSVDSVLLEIKRRARPVFEGEDARRFETMVRREFGGPQSSRARERSFEDWVEMDRRMTSGGRHRTPRLDPSRLNRSKVLSAPATRRPRGGGRG